MNDASRLTIPMDNNLHKQLKKRAAELGFDSSQALLRYVSKAIVDGRKVTFGNKESDDWGEPSPAAIARLEREIADIDRQLKTGEAKIFDNVDDLMADLHGET